MHPLKNLPLLMNAFYYAFNRGLDADFKPVIHADGSITTFCNQAIQYVCNSFGYSEFHGMSANEMISYMENYAHGWITQDEPNAQQRANQGVIVIAGHKKDPHGHVCLVVPGILEKSASFGRAVPKVLNIGKDVFIGKRISLAFRADEMPTYFALASQI